MKNNFSEESVRIFWNSVADKYEETNSTVKLIHYQRFEQAMNYKLDYDPKRILNVWCRTGEGIKFINKKYPNAEIYNLEISDKMIEIFKKKFPKEHIDKLSFKRLKFKDNFFDLIISLETIEHTPNPDIYLDELNRVLIKNKNLILSCPSAFSEIVLNIYEAFFDNHGEGPHRFMSSREMKRKFTKTGFELKDHQGFIMFPVVGKISKFINRIIEIVFNKIYLSDFGIRQFYFVRKR